MNLGKILATFLTCFRFSLEAWKLVPGPFMVFKTILIS